MAREEFLSNLNRWQKIEARNARLYETFSAKLPGALKHIATLHLPQLGHDRKQVSKLEDLCQSYTEETWEAFNFVLSDNNEKRPVKSYLSIPKRTNLSQAQSQLIEELSGFPDLLKSDYAEIFWEDYQSENARTDFIIQVYEKMKKVLVDCYFQDIKDFDSEYLRQLDSKVYHWCADCFVDNVYAIIEN